MKILHTSDWHLGRPLYGRKRYDEFTAFLDWLSGVIEQEQVNALIVAGDIFDNTTRATGPRSSTMVSCTGFHSSPAVAM
jgi:exonuclease SbcD